MFSLVWFFSHLTEWISVGGTWNIKKGIYSIDFTDFTDQRIKKQQKRDSWGLYPPTWEGGDLNMRTAPSQYRRSVAMVPREHKSQQPTPGPNTQNDSRSESNDVMWVDYIHKIGHQKPWLLFLAFFHFPGIFFSSFGIPHPTSFFLRFPEDFSMFIPFRFTFSHPTWPCDLAPGRPTGPSRWWWASTAARSPLPFGWCRKGRCWQRAKSTRPKAKRSAAGDALRSWDPEVVLVVFFGSFENQPEPVAPRNACVTSKKVQRMIQVIKSSVRCRVIWWSKSGLGF